MKKILFFLLSTTCFNVQASDCRGLIECQLNLTYKLGEFHYYNSTLTEASTPFLKDTHSSSQNCQAKMIMDFTSSDNSVDAKNSDISFLVEVTKSSKNLENSTSRYKITSQQSNKLFSGSLTRFAAITIKEAPSKAVITNKEINQDKNGRPFDITLTCSVTE